MVEITSSEQERQEDKDLPYINEGHPDDRTSLGLDRVQAGVNNIEAISQTWTRWSLIFAYLG